MAVPFSVCSLPEYERGRQDRLFADELAVKDIYTAMLRLGSAATIEALRGPARIETIEKCSDGMGDLSVLLCMLDPEDLLPLGSFDGNMTECGIWVPHKMCAVLGAELSPDAEPSPVKEVYLLPRKKDAIEDELMELVNTPEEALV